MTNITAAMIKELRERTGVGMGKCKEALEESKGDIEEAIAILRKAGLSAAAKKSGREAKEGLVAASENGTILALAEINAETDFVVNNERFQKFAKDIVEEIAKTKPATLEAFLSQKFSQDGSLTIDEYRGTVVQAIGENILVKRILAIPKNAAKSVGFYSHMGGKLVTVVEIEGSDQAVDLAKDIAMHIAAASPDYVKPEDVPSSITDQEKEIAKGQLAGKPAAMMDKIIAGKMNAFYDQVCLLRQKYIRDDSKSVEELVAELSKKLGKPLNVTRFTRWAVGS